MLTSMSDVTIKDFAALYSGVDSDISIEISTSNSVAEAVGPSIIIEATNIKVNGEVGSNVKLIGNTVTVLGQTHKSSKVSGKNLFVDTLKGEASGDKINIKKLDSGEIDGDEIRVADVAGGKISGKNIYIHKLRSNAKIMLLKLLEIKIVEGGQNQITISPKAYSKTRECIERDTAKMRRLNETLKQYILFLKKGADKIHSLKSVTDNLKEIIEENNRSGASTPQYIKNNIKDYMDIINKTREAKNKVIDIKNRIEEIDSRLKSVDDECDGAVVICENGWRNNNDISYERIFPKKISSVLVKDGEVCKIVATKKDELIKERH